MTLFDIKSKFLSMGVFFYNILEWENQKFDLNADSINLTHFVNLCFKIDSFIFTLFTFSFFF